MKYLIGILTTILTLWSCVSQNNPTNQTNQVTKDPLYITADTIKLIDTIGSIYFRDEKGIRMIGEVFNVKYDKEELNFIKNCGWEERPSWCDLPEYVGHCPQYYPGVACYKDKLLHFLKIDTINHVAQIYNGSLYYIQDSVLTREFIFNNGNLIDQRFYSKSEIKLTRRIINRELSRYNVTDYDSHFVCRFRRFNNQHHVTEEIWFPASAVSVSSCSILYDDIIFGEKYVKRITLTSNHPEKIKLSFQNNSVYKWSLDSLKATSGFYAEIEPKEKLTIFLHYFPEPKTFKTTEKLTLNTNLKEQSKINFYITVHGGYLTRATFSDTTAIEIKLSNQRLILPIYTPYSNFKLSNIGTSGYILSPCINRQHFISAGEIAGKYELTITGCGLNLRKELIIKE